MKKLFILSTQVIIFCLLVVQTTSASFPEVSVENISVTPLNYASTDYSWFLVRCTVENTGKKSGTVAASLRTIDKWAYDRKLIRLSGHVEAGEKATLTVLSYMDYKMFQNVRKYKVRSVELY